MFDFHWHISIKMKPTTPDNMLKLFYNFYSLPGASPVLREQQSSRFFLYLVPISGKLVPFRILVGRGEGMIM